MASHREGLLDIAQRASYQVTWIDNNSGCKRACDRVQQYQIAVALKQKWCDSSGECLDEILVDSLQDYLSHLKQDDTQSHLIVLHQMGSHGPAYFKRSKAPYQPFQPMCNSNAIQGCSTTELNNSYDNSIIYTDHVLSQLIQTLQQQNSSQVACLKSQVNHSLSHDYLFPTLLSLLNLKTQVSEPKNDMLHLCLPHLQPQQRA